MQTQNESNTISADQSLDEFAELMQAPYFGECPECGAEGVCLNIYKTQFMVCHEHKVCWCIGTCLLDGWQDESEETWKKNKELLNTYTRIEAREAFFLRQQKKREESRATYRARLLELTQSELAESSERLDLIFHRFIDEYQSEAGEFVLARTLMSDVLNLLLSLSVLLAGRSIGDPFVITDCESVDLMHIKEHGE
jgi:ssDNA-binding Zn-finger/Zn-ribbon topoisomerase 1